MPRFAADRILLSPVGDVWTFLAEPYHLSDWWPGISGIEPDRRGLAPGARWQIRGTEMSAQPMFGPGLLRRPGAAGMLLVTDVVPGRRIAFHLVNEHVEAEIELEPRGEDRTRVGLVVDAPWWAMRRSFPHRALARLYELVQTAAGA